MSSAWWTSGWWSGTGHDWSSDVRTGPAASQGSSAGPSQADWPRLQTYRSATSSSSREADSWQAGGPSWEPPDSQRRTAGGFPSTWAPATVPAVGAAAAPQEAPPRQERPAASSQPMPPASEPHPEQLPPLHARPAASPQPMPPANEPSPAPPPPASAEAGPLAKSSAVAPPGLPPAGHAPAPACGMPQPPAGLESMPGQDLNRAAAVQLGSPAPPSQQQQPAEDLTQAPPRSSGSEPSPTRRQEQQQQTQGTSQSSTGNDAAAFQVKAAEPQQQPAEDLTQAPPRSCGSEPSQSSTGNDAVGSQVNAAKLPQIDLLPVRAAALAPPPGIQQGPAQSESPPAEPKQHGASDGEQPVPARALAEVVAAAAALPSVQPKQFPTLGATPPLPPPPEVRPPSDARPGDATAVPPAPPPEAARTEQPAQQPIRVWT